MSVGTHAPHILVFDDDQATLGLYRDLLLDAGYRVTLRRHPPDDPDDVAQRKPDLILLDLVFDGEERGWPFFQALRQHAATAAIPVLVCTAAAQLVEQLESEITTWSCGLLLKPFDIDRLLEALNVCLERPDHDQAVG